MKRTKSAAYLSLSAAMLTVLVGCGQSVSEVNEAKSSQSGTKITNCSVEHTYPAESKKVVALSPGQADIVARLGAGDKIAGIAQLNGEKMPASLTDQGHTPPVLSENTPPTREQLLKVQPDLVLAPTTYEFNAEQGYATQEQLKQSGAETYVAASGCLDNRSKAKVHDFFTDLDAYGKILGREDDAKKLAEQAQQQLDDATARYEGKSKKSVAQLYIEGNNVTAIGAGIEHSIAEAAGADGVFNPDDAAFKEFFAAEVSREEILKKNPEAIVFTTTSPEQEQASRKWMKENLSEVTAVKEDRLIAIPAADMLPGTWGNIDAVTTISQKLYG